MLFLAGGPSCLVLWIQIKRETLESGLKSGSEQGIEMLLPLWGLFSPLGISQQTFLKHLLRANYWASETANPPKPPLNSSGARLQGAHALQEEEG